MVNFSFVICRPNWDRIGKKIGDDYPKTDVGVFLCGPDAIGNQLRAMCKKMNPQPERSSKSIASRRASSSVDGKPQRDSKPLHRQRKFVFHKESF